MPATDTIDGTVFPDHSEQIQSLNVSGEMLSLTDMWRAAGGADSKRPVDWLRLQSTIDFAEHVSAVVGKSHDDLIQTLRGNDAGTWAHWQIAMAYAMKEKMPPDRRPAGAGWADYTRGVLSPDGSFPPRESG